MAVYDQSNLIMAYIDAQRDAWPHQDFQTFRTGRLAALEAVLEIELSIEGVRTKRGEPLFMLFASTARSLLKLDGPRAGFLDDSILNIRLRELDGPAYPVREQERRVRETLDQCRQEHLALLDALFSLLWGPIERTVTSEDLLEAGFDDSNEPELHDYYDEM